MAARKLNEEDPIESCAGCGNFVDECTCEKAIDEDDMSIYDEDEDIPDILDKMNMGSMSWGEEDD